MAKSTFFKGPKLLSLARQKANILSIDHNQMKLADLICKIQEQEGHTACFRTKKICSEMTCCWQASCGAQLSPH